MISFTKEDVAKMTDKELNDFITDAYADLDKANELYECEYTKRRNDFVKLIKDKYLQYGIPMSRVGGSKFIVYTGDGKQIQKIDIIKHDKYYIPNIMLVVPDAENYSVYVYFDDGKVVYFDTHELIERGHIFEKLRDKKFFFDKCSIINYTLAWDTTDHFDPYESIDIDPETLYDLPDVKRLEVQA